MEEDEEEEEEGGEERERDVRFNVEAEEDAMEFADDRDGFLERLHIYIYVDIDR